MAFLGNDRTTLDSKRRLVVAAKYRRCLKPEAKESFVVTRGLDGCIHAYPLDEWDAVIAPRVAAIPEGTPEGRALRRRFLFHATEVQLDKQGRLLLPQPLADEAQVTEDSGALLVGNSNFVEIWNPIRYQQLEAEQDAAGLTYEAMAAKVLVSNGAVSVANGG